MTALAVEFCGPPGAGKTTLATAVARRLSAAGQPVACPTRRISTLSTPRRVTTKAAIASRRAVGEPAATVADLRALAGTDQRRLSDLLRVAFNWQFVCGLTGRERTSRRFGPADGRVALHDQGVFQALWSVGFGAKRWEAMRAVAVPGRCLPDLLVVVRADVETLVGRLADRDGDTRVDGSRPAVERAVEGADRLDELAAEYERAVGRPALLRVDNSEHGPPEERIERVVRAVQSRL